MKFEFQTTGIEKAKIRYHGAGDRSANLRPAFSKIADDWISSERRQFASKKGWAPLAKSTRERKLRQGYGLTVMRQTGALERALTIRRSRGQTIRLNRQSMSVGLLPKGKVFYGKFHQKGTDAASHVRAGRPKKRTPKNMPRGKGMPQRKVVVFDRLAEAKVEPTILNYIIHGSRTTRR